MQRAMEARPQGSLVAKKRAAARASSDNRFEAFCARASPFISIGFLRQHIHAGLELPRGGRGCIDEAHFKFPVGHGKEHIYAVLSSVHGQAASLPEDEAQDVLDLLAMAADEDLIFWSYLCLPADDDDFRDTVLRIFNSYSVHSIIKCSPERSLMQLAASSSATISKSDKLTA